jgi:VanZ family protein
MVGAGNKRRVFVVAGWALAALVVWLSVSPRPIPLDEAGGGDKLGHGLAYAVLMLWFCLLYGAQRTRLGYALLWIAMGIGLEFVQRELGYRHYDVADMAANACGVLIGWALSFAVPKGYRQGFSRKLR